MSKYEPVIGLEIHAQLLTKTKMFCRCSTSFGDKPNSNICPRCTGQPGTLPVTNGRAIEFAIRAGLAMNCEIRNTSVFARKNYFYPDLPKGYQISQYDKPLCENGFVELILEKGEKRKISIIRIHLEEDSGKLLHDFGDKNVSHVDYNRSGIPLIEIVSGPDIRSPEEAGIYLKTLRSILMYLEICDGDMEKGSFRCDANISIRPVGVEKFGTRTELKNLNSFKAVEAAISYEMQRQEKILESGKKVIQETLLWDKQNGVTESMRSKEEAHDYRYFPEPDLPPLVVDAVWIEKIKGNLPELANVKAARFVKEYGIPEYDSIVLTQDKNLAAYFEGTIKHFNSPKKISNWIMTELLRELKNDDTDISKCRISPENLSKLVEMIEKGDISGKIGKAVFEEMYKTGEAPSVIVKNKGLVQISDSGSLEKIVDKVIAANSKEVEKYKSGKVGLFGHFVGQVMKETKGQANPAMVNDLLRKKLG